MKKLKKLFQSLFFIVIILFSLTSCNGLVIPENEPGTFTYLGYSSTNDGYLQTFGSGITYSVAHNLTYADKVDTDSDCGFVGQNFPDCHCHYILIRSFVYFDTSSIPSDAIITSATLSLYFILMINDAYVPTDFDIVIRNGQPVYPHEPLEANDFYYLYYSGNGGSVNTNGLSFNSYTNMEMNETGKNWIQKGSGAITKFALFSSRDINKTAPTGEELIAIYLSEEGMGYKPKLVVNYTLSE
jgi:hypothetical protein